MKVSRTQKVLNTTEYPYNSKTVSITSSKLACMFTHKFSYMSSLGQQQCGAPAAAAAVVVAAKPTDRNLFRRGSFRRDIIMLAEMMFFSLT